MDTHHHTEKLPKAPLIYSFLVMIGVGLFGMASAETQVVFDPNHPMYQTVLSTVVKDGLVNYQSLKASPESLKRYQERLSQVTRSQFDTWEEPDQLAMLINLYNAATLELIITHYPVNSIRDIGSFFRGPWKQRFVRLFGDTITLDTLEHKIIRVDYDEPRIHMVLVCAAIGCPNLRDEPYVGSRLEAQMDEQTEAFLTSDKGMVIDRENKTVSVSSIFKWYGDDWINKYSPAAGFDGLNRTEKAVMAFCSRYVSQQDRAYLAAGGYRVRYLDYDWSLNKQKEKSNE